MAAFTCVATGPNGRETLTIESSTVTTAAQALKDRGLQPIKISAAAGGGAAAKQQAEKAAASLFKPKIGRQDVQLFARQMYVLLRAGVPLLRALASLREASTNKTFKSVLEDILKHLESGVRLSDCLVHHPKVFDAFFCSMVRVGEETGSLEAVFLELAKHLEFEAQMRRQVKSALRYPTFVVLAITAAIVIVNLFVIPAFAGMFKQFGASLPIYTRILLATSKFFVDHGAALGAGAAAAFAALRWYIGTPNGRMTWDTFILKAPIAGPIVLKASMSRFTRSFAIAIRAGVPLLQAIEIVAETADNVRLTQQLNTMGAALQRGESMHRAAKACGIFPHMVLTMIAVADETGAMDELMESVSDIYTTDVQHELKTLAQNIEPILVVAVGGMVLVLALGIFIPMWDVGKVMMRK